MDQLPGGSCGIVAVEPVAAPAAGRAQKNLTRRANHVHKASIARISSPRRETGRGLCHSDGGRIQGALILAIPRIVGKSRARAFRR